MGFIPTQQLWINLWKLWIAIGNYSRCPWIAGAPDPRHSKRHRKRFRGPHRRRGGSYCPAPQLAASAARIVAGASLVR